MIDPKVKKEDGFFASKDGTRLYWQSYHAPEPRAHVALIHGFLDHSGRYDNVYEALTAVRPYKARMSPLRAYRIMMALPGQFDPLLLRHFIQGNGIYPVGSRVKLGTGEIARVRRQTGDVEKPVVEVEVSSAGTALRSGRRPERDLSRGDGTELYLVRQLLLDDDAA